MAGMSCELLATSRAVRAISAGDPMVLGSIRRRNVMLALWARASPWSGSLPGAPCCFRAVAEAAEPDEVAASLDVPGGLPGPLRADIAGLGALFCAVIGRPTLRARLELIEHDACKRFHLDSTGYRLLCTYSGRGTEWRLGEAEQPNSLVEHAAPGSVLMLKGRARGGAGLVHRSPAVAHLPAAERHRLVLCLDEPA